MPPSELIVASALGSTLPAFFSVPAFAPDLAKIMRKYRRHSIFQSRCEPAHTSLDKAAMTLPLIAGV